MLFNSVHVNDNVVEKNQARFLSPIWRIKRQELVEKRRGVFLGRRAHGCINRYQNA